MAAVPQLKKSAGNLFSTTLSADITDTALTMTVANATGLNASGGYLIIDEAVSASREIVYYESVASNTITIATGGRGLSGTTGVAHISGATVTDILVKEHVNDMVDQIQVEHNDNGTHTNFTQILTGWLTAPGTPTYSAYDSTVKSGTINYTSASSIFSKGMKISFSQTTDGQKYGIITKVDTNSFEVFLGTDYDLDNETISSLKFSLSKTPLNFPSSPTKWRLTKAPSTTTLTSGLTAYQTVDNLPIAIGDWVIGYNVTVTTDSNGVQTSHDAFTALSTGPTTASDTELEVRLLNIYSTSTDATFFRQHYASKPVSLTSKTTYYLNLKVSIGSYTAIGVRSDSARVIFAECALL